MSRGALGGDHTDPLAILQGFGLAWGIWLKAGGLGPRERSGGQRQHWVGFPGGVPPCGTQKPTSPTPPQELVTVCSDARYIL